MSIIRYSNGSIANQKTRKELETMNWNQHLSVCTDVIGRIDNASRGSRVIGVFNEEIVVVIEEPKGENWHKITKLSHFDIVNGLSSDHWNIIGAKIRGLCREGVLL